MLGPERKSHLLTKKEKELTAYHEAGHALVSSVLEYADPVHKISIIIKLHLLGDVPAQSCSDVVEKLLLRLHLLVLKRELERVAGGSPTADDRYLMHRVGILED